MRSPNIWRLLELQIAARVVLLHERTNPSRASCLALPTPLPEHYIHTSLCLSTSLSLHSTDTYLQSCLTSARAQT